MKKILTISIIFFSLKLYAQTISGIVYRENTETAVTNASVYYGGTMIGTTTDNNGNFDLPAKDIKIPILVSCVGYYSASITRTSGKRLIIYLKPKTESLREVSIHPDGMNRADEIALFKREFLGVSKYANDCTIKNLSDVSFFYDKKSHTLTATADTPIIIDNKLLGYSLKYYLDEFRRTPKEVFFAGNYVFEDKITTEMSETVNKNRFDVYNGSRMQLIRSLWGHTLSKTDFRLFDSLYGTLNEDSVTVRDSTGLTSLHLKYKILVDNVRRSHSLSSISQSVPFSFIDRDGYYGAGLSWTGELGFQRVAVLLPFEYWPEQNNFAEFSKKVLTKNLSPQPQIRKDIPKKRSDIQSKRDIFKSIVLGPENGIDSSLTVKKWQQPILYKIYRGTNKYDEIMVSYIEETFKKLASITGHEINVAKSDSAVNFFILLDKPSKLVGIVPSETIQYLNKYKGNSVYYDATGNGFTRVVAYLKSHEVPKDFELTSDQIQAKWFKILILMLKGLGFQGSTDNPESIFCDYSNWWKPQYAIKPLDVEIIKTLYNDNLKSGMNEHELDIFLQHLNF